MARGLLGFRVGTEGVGFQVLGLRVGTEGVGSWILGFRVGTAGVGTCSASITFSSSSFCFFTKATEGPCHTPTFDDSVPASSSSLLPFRLELSDQKVYEPQIRALLGTTSPF